MNLLTVRPDLLVLLMIGPLLSAVLCYILCINAGDIDDLEEKERLKKEREEIKRNEHQDRKH